MSVIRLRQVCGSFSGPYQAIMTLARPSLRGGVFVYCQCRPSRCSQSPPAGKDDIKTTIAMA
jgi:hypothetical protein